MNKRQFKHASRTARANGMEFAERFFRSYPDRIAALVFLDGQQRDRLADREYMKSLAVGS